MIVGEKRWVDLQSGFVTQPAAGGSRDPDWRRGAIRDTVCILCGVVKLSDKGPLSCIHGYF